MTSPEHHPVKQIVETYARPRVIPFVGGLLLLFIARIPQRVPALLIGITLDQILLTTGQFSLPLVPDQWIPEPQMYQLLFIAGLIAAAVIAESALHWAGGYVFGKAKLEALHELRTETFDTLVNLDMSYFDKNKSGDIMSIINNDVNNMEDLANAARFGTIYTGELLIAFAFMLFIQWELALILVSIPVIIWLTSRAYSTLLEPRYENVRASVGEVNFRLREVIGGISTVKAFSREDLEFDRVSNASSGYKTNKWSTLRLRLTYNGMMYGVASLGSWGLFLVGSYWILSGPPLFFSEPVTTGALLTFLIYAQSFLDPSRQLAVDVIDKYENAFASSKRVASILRHPAVRENSNDAPALRTTDGRIEYDSVVFSYEDGDENVIDDVSFDVEPGEFVGIVGPSGAGKSTLLKLLLRFYEPDRGEIRIDGQNINKCSPRSVREALGYVGQDPFLFNGTIRSNIAYMKPDATHEDIVEAAKLAGAHEFIETLTEGYDTEVGEDGSNLSGGQRQRISIARVLVRDPAVLVLDEATSHVDNETEQRIKQSINLFAESRTMFAIAHTLSTVRNADKILVFDDGELVQMGTHDDLVEQKGIYSDLWEVQVGNFADVSDDFLLTSAADDETEEDQ